MTNKDIESLKELDELRLKMTKVARALINSTDNKDLAYYVTGNILYTLSTSDSSELASVINKAKNIAKKGEF